MMIPFALLGLAMLPNLPQDGNLAGNSDTQPIQVPFNASQWRLAWKDEFDGGPNPDAKTWVYEEGRVRNGEAQYYTKNRRENSRIEGGNLIIEARKDNWNDNPITSASLTTEGQRWFKYGRIEVRAQIPTGRGTWPAIWTLGKNIREVGWPKCGEMDIMENVGFDPKGMHANVHTDAYNHTKGNGKGKRIESADPWTKFNVYAVEWYKDRLEFFLNDTRFLVYRNEGKGETSWPFDQPHYLILNVAIGGAWGGAQGIDDAILPCQMKVDYVRYYESVK